MEWLSSRLTRRFLNLIPSLVRWRSRLLFLLGLLLSLVIPFLGVTMSLSSPILQSQPDASPLVNQAKEYYHSQQFEEATKLWQQAAEVFAAQGDRLNQAMALSNLSRSEQPLGHWAAAQDAIANSLTLLQALGQNPTQQRILASTLDIQGQLYLAIGQPQNALKTWQSSKEIYQTIRDRKSVKLSQINQAQALQELGLYPRACSLLFDALEFKAPACEVSPQVLQLLASDQPTPSQILGLRSLGNVLRLMGEFEQSQFVLVKSWYLAQKLGSYGDLAAIYLALGNTARALGNSTLPLLTRQPYASVTLAHSVACLPKEAENKTNEFYEQAASCYRQAAATVSPLIALQAQLNLLSLAIQTQQDNQIPGFLPTLQSQINRLPPSRAAIYAQLKFAQNLLCLQSRQSTENPRLVSPILQSCSPIKLNARVLPRPAISFFPVTGLPDLQQQITTALRQAQELGDQQTEATALGYLAAVAQQNGHLTKAQQFTEQALQKLSAFDNPELAYLWQWQLGRLYQLQAKPQEAIAAYTLAWQILQSLRQDLVASNPDIQFTFRDRVEPVYRELVDLLLQAQNPSQAALKQARDIIESLQVAELNNFFKEACLETQPQQIEQLDPQAAVIYSIILPERLAIIVSIPGQPLRHYSTLFTPAQGGTQEIERVYDNLSATLNFAPLNSQLLNPNALIPHQQFYDWLIRPVEADLAQHGIKTLAFVLDGILRNVPLSALHDGQQYLIERYNLALTPGLQLFNPRHFTLNQAEVLLGGLTEGRQGFVDLPGVKQEIKEISAIAPTEVLLNPEFTRTRLEAKIQSHNFPIIHLATHGQFSSQAAETYLLTWDELINVKKFDQMLRANDSLSREGNNFYTHSPIQLLVLSACQTAVGDKRAALGLAGLAVRSGAASTLATLWSVQDESTALFMTRFYTVLNQSQVTKADALRQAQLSLLHSPQYQHPFYWAPFVLVGNWL